jgi:hypothetical protein
MRGSMGALDVPAFLLQARIAYVVVALLWLALLLRLKKPNWLLAGALGANAFVWLETMFPLQRLYGLGTSSDRLGNLGLTLVVAAAGKPQHTSQAGQLHFEPFWGALVAFLAAGNPDRVLALYPWLSLVTACGVVLAVYHGLRPLAERTEAPGDGAGSPWERVFAAAGVTLLCTAPFDFAGTYRAPWAMTFLLKPNHALGLVLFPLLLRSFAGVRTWTGRLGVGLLLHLLGWIFVVHMVYVCAGLALFAACSFWQRRPERAREAVDVAVVIGVNVAVVSPYLAMLLWGYPIFDPGPSMGIRLWSAHLLEPTVLGGVSFALAVWGYVVMTRREDRLSRLWTTQVAAALVLWVAYLALGRYNLAKERDELFYWLRFLMGALAGMGAWDLGARAARHAQRLAEPSLRAATLGLVLLPLSLPYWWDPLRMDAYFAGSLEPLPALLRLPTDYIRHHLPARAIVAGDPDYARWVAGLGARRVFLATNLHQTRDHIDRVLLQDATMRHEPDAAATLRARGVTHLAVTPVFLANYPEVTLRGLRARPDLQEVHFTGDPARDYVALFALVP